MTDQPITPADEALQRIADGDFETASDAVAIACEALTRPSPDAVLRAAALDALAGWRYIRMQHGDLYGVGWDRVENALTAALASPASTAGGEVEAERWSWGYPDGVPGTSEYEPAARICNRCKTVESRCVCEAATIRASDLLTAAARIETLEAALEPFDDALGEDDEFPDDTPITVKWGRTTYYALTLGDLRRARNARNALRKGNLS